MKKILLTTIFAIAGLCAFANNANDKREADKTQAVERVAKEDNCTDIKLSCGVNFKVCGFSGTLGQLVELVKAAEEVICNSQSV